MATIFRNIVKGWENGESLSLWSVNLEVTFKVHTKSTASSPMEQYYYKDSTRDHYPWTVIIRSCFRLLDYFLNNCKYFDSVYCHCFIYCSNCYYHCKVEIVKKDLQHSVSVKKTMSCLMVSFSTIHPVSSQKCRCMLKDVRRRGVFQS